MGEDTAMELGPLGIAGLAVLFLGVLYWAFRSRRNRPPGDGRDGGDDEQGFRPS